MKNVSSIKGIWRRKAMPRVIVVDDEESSRFVFKEFLTKAGYEVPWHNMKLTLG